MTTNRDMMTDAPSSVLAREIRAYLESHGCGAWTVGEAGWDGAVVLQHQFRPQGRVYSLDEATAHMSRYA